MRSRFLLLGFLVGMVVLVLATNPVWQGDSVIYNQTEGAVYLHDLRNNVSGFDDDVNFVIDTDQDVTWTNSSGTYDIDASVVSSWLYIANVSLGDFVLNATLDNETGRFLIPFQAINTTDDPVKTSGVTFTFDAYAMNDIPIIADLNSSYDFPQNEVGAYTINAVDEEGNYPLTFGLTFIDNCTHASWSGRMANENCSIFNVTDVSDIATSFNFDPSLADVGTYWANFSVWDTGGTCPHAYCDVASYEQNQSTEIYLLKFNVYSVLTVDVSNCTGATVMQGETFNCTVNVTTRGEDDFVNFSSAAEFRVNPSSPYNEANRDWFYGDAGYSASNFFYSLPISVTPGKEEVGNWTINFTAEVLSDSNLEMEQFVIFVNYTESSVSLDAISDVTIYEDYVFDVDAHDSDLLIWDASVKNEGLTFESNTTWAVAGVGVESSGTDVSKSTISIDHSAALAVHEGNHSVLINVSDINGSVAERVFVVEIINETAPVWASLSNPVVLNLTENVAFSYNVSKNVTDDDPLVFYYENVSAEFCSLTSSNFNYSSGIIDFSPENCDVGLHNVSIIASDGKLNSSWNFVFNVSNVLDASSISQFTGENGTTEIIVEGFDFVIPESLVVNFSLDVEDLDFLIPFGQRDDYYNETLSIDVTFMNSTGSCFDLFNFSLVGFSGVGDRVAEYEASFTAGVAEVGDYVVFVNITDAAGDSINRTWNLNVTESLDAPVLEEVANVSLIIHDVLNFSLDAWDEENNHTGTPLNYSVVAIDVGAPDLNITGEDVFFNMSFNNSYSGIWRYNVTVNDSDSMIDWQVFYLSVYGFADLNLPVENSSFALTENVSSILNFTINHSVGDDLVYEFWIDNMTCFLENGTDLNCSYGNLSLRDSVVSFGNGSVLNWSFLSDFKDETYGLEKNLTVRVYPNVTDLSLAQKYSVASNFSFKFNITHSNAPMRAIEGVVGTETFSGSAGLIDLSNYFYDEDIDDPYYSQNISFDDVTGTSSEITLTYSGAGWIAAVATTGALPYEGELYVEGSDNLTSDVSDRINVNFEAAEKEQSSGGGSSTKTVIKFYSLRIIVPEDVIIDTDYIEIPFGLENTGTIDLSGIDLSSQVLYNNKFSDDIKVDLGVDYIDLLKSGERKEFTMKILADTDRAGKYKATIFANISSPKFFDWGDFFIDLRRTNESEAEELLIFTEKLVADNPECLELTEVFRRAKEMFEVGNTEEALRLAEEVSSACEDAIMANEQIRYRIEGFVEKNFYYISFLTLAIFFVGFIFYVYKRVRFNKSVEDEYSRGSDTDGK